jgi:hypothetical protein
VRPFNSCPLRLLNSLSCWIRAWTWLIRLRDHPSSFGLGLHDVSCKHALSDSVLLHVVILAEESLRLVEADRCLGSVCEDNPVVLAENKTNPLQSLKNETWHSLSICSLDFVELFPLVLLVAIGADFHLLEFDGVVCEGVAVLLQEHASAREILLPFLDLAVMRRPGILLQLLGFFLPNNDTLSFGVSSSLDLVEEIFPWWVVQLFTEGVGALSASHGADCQTCLSEHEV